MNFCGLGEHAGVLQQTFERMTRLEPETVAHLAASLTTAEGEELQKARAAVWCHVGESVILGCICVQVIFLWRHASSSLQWPILPAMSVWCCHLFIEFIHQSTNFTMESEGFSFWQFLKRIHCPCSFERLHVVFVPGLGSYESNGKAEAKRQGLLQLWVNFVGFLVRKIQDVGVS